MMVRCSDCQEDYRAKKGSDYAAGRVCFRCQYERREADREYAAASRMTMLVFGADDPDLLET